MPKTVNKQQLNKNVQKFKAIKDHPKLKQWSQLIEEDDKDKESETKLRGTPRKKYEKHQLYRLGEILLSAAANAGTVVNDAGERKIRFSRLQKIERIIAGEGPPTPKKEPNIKSQNARMWRERQSLLERMRPSEYHERVYQSVARKSTEL